MKSNDARAEVARLKARVAALEQLLEVQEQAVIGQAGRIEAALKQIDGQSKVLRAVFESTATETGDDFFRSLVASLASTLGVRWAFVGEVIGNRPGYVRTLALWMDGGLGENFEYALAGTPCEHVITDQRMRFFPRGVQQLFPTDLVLSDLGVESYLAFPLFSDAREAMGLVGVMHDAPMSEDSQAQSLLGIYAARVGTELRRLRVVQALQENEEKYHLLFARAMDAVMLFDVETCQIFDVNDTAIRIYGYSRDEFLRSKILDLSAEPDKTAAAIRQAMKVGGAYIPLRWYKKKDGTVFPVEISAGPFIWKGRAVMCAVLRDITERKRAEEALRESEDRFRSAFENTAVGMVLLDNNGRFLRANRAFCTLVGYSEDELLPKTFLDITHPEDLEKNLPVVKRLMAGEIKSFFIEKRYLHKQGHPVWVHASVASVRDALGKPLNFIAQSQDITERKRAEEALRESNAWLRAILDHSPAMVFLKDTEGRYLLSNRQFEQTFHLTHGAIAGKTDHDLFPPEQAAAFVANDCKVLQAGVPMEFEEVAVHDDGPHTSIVVKFPLYNEQGEIYAIGGIATDITERKSLEAQLRQSQKMEAVGRLAGGVAHDFNNLLTVIMGHSDLLLRHLGPGDPSRKYAAEIKKASDRAADLTGQLLAFSRRQVIQPRVLDLNGLVTNLVEMLRRLIGEDIHLVTTLQPGPCPVKADPGQLEQVIMNLAVNARDAMPEGGTLTIETVPVQGEIVARLGQADLAPGPHVRLTVRDTGGGMDADTKAHVFEPFFTTKGRGKGTGLGLAMVYGIIAQSGGVVTVDSAPGQGATFTIYLPQASGAVKAAGETDQPVNRASRSETILLVEDDPVVRAFVCNLLLEWGCHVVEAAGGEEALRRAAQHQGPIHLLLTDVIMPGMNGRQLAEQVRAVRPDTKTLFMSGYTDDLVLRRELQDMGVDFLQKPFAAVALQRKVWAVLDAPGGRGRGRGRGM